MCKRYFQCSKALNIMIKDRFYNGGGSLFYLILFSSQKGLRWKNTLIRHFILPYICSGFQVHFSMKCKL